MNLNLTQRAVINETTHLIHDAGMYERYLWAVDQRAHELYELSQEDPRKFSSAVNLVEFRHQAEARLHASQAGEPFLFTATHAMVGMVMITLQQVEAGTDQRLPFSEVNVGMLAVPTPHHPIGQDHPDGNWFELSDISFSAQRTRIEHRVGLIVCADQNVVSMLHGEPDYNGTDPADYEPQIPDLPDDMLVNFPELPKRRFGFRGR